MTATSEETARGALAWLLRRRWGLAAVRENARLLLGRLGHAGRGVEAAEARRAAADGPAARARRAACWEARGPLCRTGRHGFA